MEYCSGGQKLAKQKQDSLHNILIAGIVSSLLLCVASDRLASAFSHIHGLCFCDCACLKMVPRGPWESVHLNFLYCCGLSLTC